MKTRFKPRSIETLDFYGYVKYENSLSHTDSSYGLTSDNGHGVRSSAMGFTKSTTNHTVTNVLFMWAATFWVMVTKTFTTDVRYILFKGPNLYLFIFFFFTLPAHEKPKISRYYRCYTVVLSDNNVSFGKITNPKPYVIFCRKTLTTHAVR